MVRALLWCFAAAIMLSGETRFTDSLWGEIAPVYRRTLDHPYLKGLADGTLPRARFEFYLLQDAHYLRAFSQALSVIASKAPREDWAITLSRHSVEALEVERQLHKELLAQFGITKEQMSSTDVAPSNYAYTTHLLTAAHRGTFTDGLAAVLPCYWIYWEVGKELKKVGSKNASYQRWINQYSDPAYGSTVARVLEMMNVQAQRLSEEERSRAKRLFVLSSRYEYLFWDAAWRQERWLP